ncbi:MAG TPA: hypothetical protein VFF73_17000 [Planctomycetota bacterium]|nr:hypothetical protein [Planctomycetota bacterium]
MTTMNSKSVPRGIEQRADSVIQGLQTAVPTGVTQILVDQVAYQIPDLIKKAQDLVQPWKTCRGAHATVRQEMATRPTDKQNLEDFLAAFKIGLSAAVGRDNEVLTSFGFKPYKKPKALTSEQAALKAAKAKLTRQKRGTLGKKQRAAIAPATTPAVGIAPDGAVTITPENGGTTSQPSTSNQSPNGVSKTP